MMTTRGRRATKPAGLAAVAALALLAAGCSGGGHSTSQAGAATRSGATAGATAGATTGSGSGTGNAPRVTITPANGAKDADPSAGIGVTAADGTLTNVSVRTSGDPVAGSLGQGGTVWRSQWALDVSQAYTVTATASGHGGTVTVTSTFRTLTPSQTFRTYTPLGRATYGVGMPIILYFSQRITDKAAVERALQITTSNPVVGAWYWDDPCNMAPTCVYFRPRDYWPAGTTVSFTGHLNGVQGAPGVYGYHTLTQTFSIGASLIAIGNTRTHRTQIYYNGQLRYDWPISSGRPGDDTPDGSYLTIEKENPVQMTGPGYSISVPWSVRFTWSGDYYHDAYWSVGQQGFENVSHGCVNLAPADAETYYNLAIPGDPITIVGSPRGGTWDNGWTQWFLSWPQYLAGSALHQAVQAGPDGSTFVNPATLPPSTASAPLGTAPTGNNAVR
jgi:lipoprotein-anchoring transpeptidase ErfK/SrfK